MLKFLKTYKLEIVFILFILALYFLLRLPNLTLQPIFADEAIYIRWAQVMKAEPTLRFLPVTDGKTPLFMWAMIPFFKFFQDPLYAGRFLSVMSGVATLLGAFFLGWKFINLRAGLWSALLLAVTPFMVFFDRMALVDSMLAAFSLWSLFLILMVIRYLRVDLAMCLGYFLGAGLLTKTPGMFNLLVLPVSILAADLKPSGRQKRLLKILGLWLISIIIALVMYNALRLGPEFNKLSARNQDYVFSPIELVGRPLDPFIPHLHDVTEFLGKLVGLVILTVVFLGMILIGIKKNRYGLVILLWALGPLLIEMALLKTFTARYILSSIPPLLCLGGWALSEIERLMGANNVFPRALIVPVLTIAVLIYPLNFSYNLLTQPTKSNLPVNDHKGYFEEWTAGYGFPEIAQYLMNRASSGQIVVGTDGYFGTLPDGLQIYLERYTHSVPKEKQIVIIGTNGLVPESLREAAQKYPTFFVANRSRMASIPEGLQLLKEYPKAKSNRGQQDAILFFQVLPELGN